jgi:8-oxo-dGTP diphosphatase
MPSETNSQSKVENITIVNVAVAVIHYENNYLLGFRDAAQHQGNRYEFVGGKIEADESAEQALIREVAEETGIETHQNTIVKLGRLHHDYGDKQVSLQVYKIELTAQQYEQHKDCEYGLEGQAITWADKSKLLAGDYHLPAANKTILEWLRLPEKIAITYPLAHFSEQPNPAAAWLHYHQESLAPESWVYIRLKYSGSEHIAEQLMKARPDILAILPYSNDCQRSKTASAAEVTAVKINHSIVARHLTHSILMEWSNGTQDIVESEQLLFSEHPLIVSCHDISSIYAANKLASARIQQHLPPVIGAFLSPVLATQTHPDTVPLGWESWAYLAQLADMPVIGLGGLAPMMLDKALEQGGISVAGIRQFH